MPVYPNTCENCKTKADLEALIEILNSYNLVFNLKDENDSSLYVECILDGTKDQLEYVPLRDIFDDYFGEEIDGEEGETEGNGDFGEKIG